MYVRVFRIIKKLNGKEQVSGETVHSDATEKKTLQDERTENYIY